MLPERIAESASVWGPVPPQLWIHLSKKALQSILDSNIPLERKRESKEKLEISKLTSWLHIKPLNLRGDLMAWFFFTRIEIKEYIPNL